MWIHKASRPIDDLGMLGSGIVTGWGWWCSRQRCCWLWSRLAALVGWRCTCFFVSPACPQILSSAIVARKASGHMILTMHSLVSFYSSNPLFVPMKLNSPLLFFLDLGMKFLHQILCFLYCGARKPSFGHCGHFQGQVHVGLFQLYPTSLPCHISRHVENLQEFSCCF